jgi:hypothetical protein
MFRIKSKVQAMMWKSIALIRRWFFSFNLIDTVVIIDYQVNLYINTSNLNVSRQTR